jgi:hypothetical protein
MLPNLDFMILIHINHTILSRQNVIAEKQARKKHHEKDKERFQHGLIVTRIPDTSS